MANYRRNFVPGGTFFFTVNLADRRRGLLIEHIALLGAAVRHVRARHPFIIEAAVILILSQPAGDRTNFDQPLGQARTGNLAAALLGAYAAR